MDKNTNWSHLRLLLFLLLSAAAGHVVESRSATWASQNGQIQSVRTVGGSSFNNNGENADETEESDGKSQGKIALRGREIYYAHDYVIIGYNDRYIIHFDSGESRLLNPDEIEQLREHERQADMEMDKWRRNFQRSMVEFRERMRHMFSNGGPFGGDDYEPPQFPQSTQPNIPRMPKFKPKE